MSALFAKIVKLVEARDVLISTHGFKRMQAKSIALCELITGIGTAELIEDYCEYHAGPALLVLYTISLPLHAVWGSRSVPIDPPFW